MADGYRRHLTSHRNGRKFGTCQHSTASNYNFYVSSVNCQISVCNLKKKIWESFQWAPSLHSIISYHILCCRWCRKTNKNRKTQILFLNYSFEWVRYAKFKIYTKSLTTFFYPFSLSLLAAEAVYFAPTSPNISINFYAFDAPHSFVACVFPSLASIFLWMDGIIE